MEVSCWPVLGYDSPVGDSSRVGSGPSSGEGAASLPRFSAVSFSAVSFSSSVGADCGQVSFLLTWAWRL